MDFRTGTAGTGISHFPEIFFSAHFEQPVCGKAGLLQPDPAGFLIGGDLSLFILKNGRIQPVMRQLPDLGEQLPGPADGFLFIIISEGPVAHHFKKSMMGIIPTDVFKIVMFSSHPQAFLGVRSSGIFALIRSQEDIFELHHAGVCEQERGIPTRNQGGGPDKFMVLGSEEVYE
mgnify:CR=1 FL=1